MSALRIFAFILFLIFFAVFIQFGVLSIAVEKLGISPHSAFLLFSASLLGSSINLPLFKMKAYPMAENSQLPKFFEAFINKQIEPFNGITQISINVGGALIPICFSYYLWQHSTLNISTLLLAVAMVSLASFLISRPVPGLGITMPILLAPFLAAILSTALNEELRAPLAYISGTLGVLIGADLFHMKDIKKMGVPFASIGGAGSFDGIFMTGIVAVLLT